MNKKEKKGTYKKGDILSCYINAKENAFKSAPNPKDYLGEGEILKWVSNSLPFGEKETDNQTDSVYYYHVEYYVVLIFRKKGEEDTFFRPFTKKVGFVVKLAKNQASFAGNYTGQFKQYESSIYKQPARTGSITYESGVYEE
jgi:hypothetical protein